MERSCTKALSLEGVRADRFGPEPDGADLARIHQFTLEALPKEALYVRRMVLANDALDRSFERFPLSYLQRFAGTLPGKSLLISHDKAQPATGLIYQALVRPAEPGEAGDYSLVASFYLVKTPGNEEVRALIDAGVIRHVSIGFTYDTRICSVCDQDYWSCPHLPGDTTDGGQLVTFTYGGDLSRVEAREASLVYLGCQREAVITKGGVRRQALGVSDGYESTNLLRLTPDAWSESDMENEKALARVKELEARVKELESDLEKRYLSPDPSPARGGAAEGRREVRGEDPLLPSPCRGGVGGEVGAPALVDEERVLVEDGKQYREFLRAEVKRLAGIVKCEADANLLLTALPHAPARSLKELVDSYKARVEERFPPRPEGQLAAQEAAVSPTPAATQSRRAVTIG